MRSGGGRPINSSTSYDAGTKDDRMAEAGPNRARRRKAKRLAGTAGCLGAAAAIAAHAAAIGFRGSTQVTQGALTAGDLYLSIPPQGDPTGGVGTQTEFDGNEMTLAIADIYPGQLTAYRERPLDLKVGGNVTMNSMYFTVTATANNGAGTNMLADSNFGMIVDECDDDWTPSGSSPDKTYSCAGTKTAILGADGVAPVLVQPAPSGVTTTFDLTSYVAKTQNSVNHLRFRFKMSQSAANNDQGGSITLTYTFDGTRRTAANK
jgi:hypothetical protein